MAAVGIELLPGFIRDSSDRGFSHVRRTVTLQAGETLGQFLARLAAELPSLGQPLWDECAGGLAPHVQVVLNGRLIAPQQVSEYLLVDGDDVALVPVYAGGCLWWTSLTPGAGALDVGWRSPWRGQLERQKRL